GSEGSDDVVDDLFLGKAKQSGFFAVDIQFQRGVIDVLRNKDVTDGFEFANWLGDFCGDPKNFVEIVSADLNVDGGGQSEINHRIHEAARLKVGTELRQLLAELLPDTPHVF